ncbi:MAG: ABC transporter substrate-binding protein [Succinivibrio sp.]|jgi:branched-chain amino acid transport system substrate-binding protein|nr:ABC transporter substrate-binding protein [Succinivibrio sp.]
MKARIFAKAALCVSLLAVSVGSALAADNVKIGMIQPLSGPNSVFGVNCQRGMQLAVDMINEAGGIKSLGGAKLELVPADIPTPNTAAQATQRLISREKVSGIVGHFVSSSTLAASEVTERMKVPLVTFAFADQITERGYKYSFQVTPKGTVFGADQFNYIYDMMKDHGKAPKKIAILYEDTAYGTTQAKGLRAAAQAKGVEIVVDEAYPLGITDANPLINKIRATSPDIVFPVSYFNDALLLIRGMRQQGINIPAVGGAAGYVINDFRKGLGEYCEGILSVASSNQDLAPKDFVDRFEKQYGVMPTHDAISHAVAVDVMAKAIEKAGSADPKKIRDALAETNTCDGIASAIPGKCVVFDKNGLNTKTFPILVQWRGERLVTVYPKDVATSEPVLPQ